jgi:hypothetical protein
MIVQRFYARFLTLPSHSRNFVLTDLAIDTVGTHVI